MTPVLLFAALSLAVYRVFRFFGKDDITAPLRDRLPVFLHFLVSCPFCAGTWLSLAGVYATHRYLTPLEPHWLLWAIAVAGVVGLLGMVDDRLSE